MQGMDLKHRRKMISLGTSTKKRSMNLEGHLNIYGMKGELLWFLETAEELIILYNPYP